MNAISAYRRITTDPNIRFLIGPSCSPAGLAVAPVIAKNRNVVVISPSIGLRQFNEAGENIFKLWPYDEEGPKLLAQHATRQGWKRAAIFSSQQAWEEAQGDFFAEAFEKLGGQVVASVKPLQGDPDLRAAASKLLAAKPDFILLTNYIQFEIAAQELAKQGYRGPKMSTLMTEEKISLARGALDDVVAYGYQPADEGFVGRFRAKFGREPWGLGADTAYDAVLLYAAAINDTGSEDPIVVRHRMLEAKNFPGASGTWSLDAHGGVTRQPILFRVEQQKLVPYRNSSAVVSE